MFIRDSRRSYRAYSYAGLTLITDLHSFGTPVGVTELILCRTYSYTTKFLFLFGGTRRYHRDYGTCTGIAELILIRKYYRTYTGISEHILVIWILSLCESTRRYDKSELIIIVSHTGSDQTYTDTYQVWTLVHDRYISERIHILILRRREYP